MYPVRLLTDSFIICKTIELSMLSVKQHKISRHVNFWDFQRMGSRAGVNGVQETVLQEIQEDKEALLTIFMGNPKISVGLRKYGPLLEAS